MTDDTVSVRPRGKLGLIGGLGPEVTLDYYKRLTHHFRAQGNGLSLPELIIYSANIGELFAFARGGQWEAVEDWLLARPHALQAAGASVAAMTGFTPHIVFDRLAARAPLPLVSIVQATVDHVRALGIQRVGVLGTKFTMHSGMFDGLLRHAQVSSVLPDDDEQQCIPDPVSLNTPPAYKVHRTAGGHGQTEKNGSASFRHGLPPQPTPAGKGPVAALRATAAPAILAARSRRIGSSGRATCRESP